ncbi:hypothetical protein [Demequina sp.]|uniref:hypothetical protein n=1 Tax=Demequina sp. TaxID=2050685 RepID=UPI0025D590BB|nr:hypothetical protein [Demequina sp.]
MNKALAPALVGVLGLALGFGAGWAWENLRGEGPDTGAESPAASTTPTADASS